MKTISPRIWLLILIALPVFLSGCVSSPPRPNAALIAMANLPPPAAPTDGSIWRPGGGGDLVADPKARRVGDILTIVLQESMQASKKSSTTTSKKDSTNLKAPLILGTTASYRGIPLATALSSDNSFKGAGSSSQSNQLTGEITVVVVRRLPNGVLMVRGQKWLTINQGRELVRLSGLVRPQDIGPDNTVSSNRVADAQIVYTGRGVLASANEPGWLGRFFNSKWWPF